MRLSILICTVTDRKSKLDRLLKVLQPQVTSDVEILVNSDNRTKIIGKKRNELMDIATGTYICYIDDDDLVADNYIKLILDATTDNPDCVGFEGIITFSGEKPTKFIHTIRCTEWCTRDGIYYRTPNHLNPIKKSIASTIKFPEINHGEDRHYSDGVKSLLKTEEYIGAEIYYYLSEVPPQPKHTQSTKRPRTVRVRRPQ